jgi:hypothetical protein
MRFDAMGENRIVFDDQHAGHDRHPCPICNRDSTASLRWLSSGDDLAATSSAS